jgi:hypothetical protein
LARRFRSFADVDCRGYSPLYEGLSHRVADDDDLLDLLGLARPGQRRPVLFLAAVNFLGGMTGTGDWPAFRQFCLDHRDAIVEIIETRATQTNEVGRCAVLLPAFQRAALESGRPLALVEVGASAGLNLLFDRYSYRYGDVVLGSGTPMLSCDAPPSVAPTAFPEVAWRVGIDREPVDVTDDAAVAWLRACVFADQLDRVARLDAAVTTAREQPPTIVAGDAIETLAAVVDAAPKDAHLCIFHTWVVSYFLRDQRTTFFDLLNALGAERDLTWISGEAPGVVPDLGLAQDVQTALGVVTFAGGAKRTSVVGTFHPHGAWLRSASG